MELALSRFDRPFHSWRSRIPPYHDIQQRRIAPAATIKRSETPLQSTMRSYPSISTSHASFSTNTSYSERENTPLANLLVDSCPSSSVFDNTASLSSSSSSLSPLTPLEKAMTRHQDHHEDMFRPDRNISPETTSSSIQPVSKHHHPLRKAVTWLGNTFRKWQQVKAKTAFLPSVWSAPAKGTIEEYQDKTNTQHLHIARTTTTTTHSSTSDPAGNNNKKQLQPLDTTALPVDVPDNKDVETTVSCQVLRITNKASSREQDYELDIRVNDVSQTLVRGTLTKVTKGVSSSSGPAQPLVYKVNNSQPLELTFVVAVQQRPRHSIAEAVRTVMLGLGNRVGRRRPSLAAAADVTKPVVVGVAQVSFRDNPQLLCTGHRLARCYKLMNPNKVKGWDLDMTVELSIEEAVQPPAQPSCLASAADIQCSQPLTTVTTNTTTPATAVAAPWQYYAYASSLAVDDEQEDEEQELEPRELEAALTHSRAGDYLTFYVRSQTFAKWERFWAVLRNDELVLYDFSYRESREAVDRLPLVHLNRVAKPSIQDQENVCLAQAHGLVLQMDRRSATMMRPVQIDQDERLEGKIYVFADDATKATLWRKTLSFYYQLNNNNKAVVTDNSTEFNNPSQGVNLRFLW